MSTKATNFTDLNASLARISTFLQKCPVEALKAPFAQQARELELQAWTFVQGDMTLLDEATKFSDAVTALIGSVKQERTKTNVDKHIALTPESALKAISELTWDGVDRLGDGAYLQSVFNTDHAIDDKYGVKAFYVGAVRRLAVPGTTNNPLILGGKKPITEPLAMALASALEPANITEPRNLRPERCTALSVFNGLGKTDDVLVANEDKFTRPFLKQGEKTEPRWMSFIATASVNPRNLEGRTFIPVGAKPDVDKVKADAKQLLAQAYSLYHAEVTQAPVSKKRRAEQAA